MQDENIVVWFRGAAKRHGFRRVPARKVPVGDELYEELFG